jgi:hypothetical protein
MFNLNDIENIESPDEFTSPESYYRSIQKAINSGMWALQGSYGRTMMEAIEQGYCVLGVSPARDGWGNYIPSRDQVQAGTKGSVEYSANLQGEKWAEWVSEVV